MTGGAQAGHVLVVDDDRVNRLLLTRSLEREGHRVSVADNGRTALGLLGEDPPDVVLLDIVMPELDGVSVLERIKGDSALQHLPVIMISAIDEIESVIRCIELGAEDYLAKPFNRVLLRARVGACLERKRLHDREAAHLAEIEAQRRRADELYKTRSITEQEHEQALLDHATANAEVVRSRVAVDNARDQLDDTRVRAPITGTVIEKQVERGQVISSPTRDVGGGTVLLRMADLGLVQVRALVDETDIGQVQPGQQATVTVDAYPDRPFRGAVEKIEPQAVVQQSVTMFPVLVSIQNREGLLKPGMNGEVSVLVDQRTNVIAVPNDAVRSVREAA